MEIDVKAFLKEVRELSINGKEVIEKLLELHNGDKLPNCCLLNNEHLIFNVQMSELVKNLRMNFSIYQSGINAYLLELVTFIPQEDYRYPPDTTPGSELFTITAPPALGAHSLQRAINALTLDEAVEASLEYVFDNMENILREAMGGESIQPNPTA